MNPRRASLAPSDASSKGLGARTSPEGDLTSGKNHILHLFAPTNVRPRRSLFSYCVQKSFFFARRHVQLVCCVPLLRRGAGRKTTREGSRARGGLSDRGGSEQAGQPTLGGKQLPVTGVFQTVSFFFLLRFPFSRSLAPLRSSSLALALDHALLCGSLELWNNSTSVPKCEGTRKGREKREERTEGRR